MEKEKISDFLKLLEDIENILFLELKKYNFVYETKKHWKLIRIIQKMKSDILYLEEVKNV